MGSAGLGRLRGGSAQHRRAQACAAAPSLRADFNAAAFLRHDEPTVGDPVHFIAPATIGVGAAYVIERVTLASSAVVVLVSDTSPPAPRRLSVRLSDFNRGPSAWIASRAFPPPLALPREADFALLDNTDYVELRRRHVPYPQFIQQLRKLRAAAASAVADDDAADRDGGAEGAAAGAGAAVASPAVDVGAGAGGEFGSVIRSVDAYIVTTKRDEPRRAAPYSTVRPVSPRSHRRLKEAARSQAAATNRVQQLMLSEGVGRHDEPSVVADTSAASSAAIMAMMVASHPQQRPAETSVGERVSRARARIIEFRRREGSASVERARAGTAEQQLRRDDGGQRCSVSMRSMARTASCSLHRAFLPMSVRSFFTALPS